MPKKTFTNETTAERMKRENSLFHKGDLHPKKIREIMLEREKLKLNDNHLLRINEGLETVFSDRAIPIKPPGKR